MSKYPILFELDETQFNTHGIGVLSDATQCDVTEEINGVFELNMLYPSTGRHVKDLKNNRIIFADASKELGQQPFRICRVTKMLNGLINVYAYHISYDLGGIQLPPFEADGIAEAFQKMKQYSTSENRFNFQTSMEAEGIINLETPTSVRAYLMGSKNSVLRLWGGELTFDRFNVFLSSARGSDKGFRVRYGVNMVDLNQEESIEKTYTGIYPYYKDALQFTDMTQSYDTNNLPDVDVSKLSNKIMYAKGTFDHHRIASVDIANYLENGAPLSTDEVREAAEKYMEEHEIGIPSVSLDVRFESLRKSPEYANVSFMEDVSLGDTIHVDFVKLGVSSVGRINSIIYDSLKHKNKRVSIGDPKSNITDTIYTIENRVKESETAVAGLSKSVARIEVLSNQNSAKVELLVETNKAGENVVRGSVLVEAINGQSTATISADKVNLTGYVTVNSLKTDGSTVIDGSRIQTGRIQSSNYEDEIAVIVHDEMDVAGDDTNTGSPYTYWFYGNELSHFLGYEPNTNFKITFSNQFVNGYGSYIYIDKAMNVTFVDNKNGTSETVKATEGSGKCCFYVDGRSLLSQKGTSFNLNDGSILSEKFGFGNIGSYFAGKISSDIPGNIGGWKIGPYLEKKEKFVEEGNENSWSVKMDPGSLIFDSSILFGENTHSTSSFDSISLDFESVLGTETYSAKYKSNEMEFYTTLGVYKGENGSFEMGFELAKIENAFTQKKYRVVVDESSMALKVIPDN